MNCCDEYGDCRQGRDCPVRTQGAKVAKIGRRAHKHAQPLRHSLQRAYLKDLAERLADAADARSVELMEPGEDCDPCDGCNVAAALEEANAKEQQVLGQLIRDGKFAEAGIFLRGISHTYWAAKALEQAYEEFA